MHSKIKYLPINWWNGMPFSADHLNNQFLAMADMLKDVSALHLNSSNYGLLGGDVKQKSSNSFIDNITNEKVEVSHCRAITQNGSRIEIINKTWEELNKPLSILSESEKLETDRFWYVLLIVHPFSRVPDGEEDQARKKTNTRSEYKLKLMSLGALEHDNLENAIPLAKFENTSSGLRKVSSYIPPCTRLNSNEKLMKKYEEYEEYMYSLKECSEKIIDKIKDKRSRNKEQNRLADDIDGLCRTYLDFFVKNYDDYRLNFKDLPPIRLVEFFARFARILNHSLDTAYDKNHVLQYFRQYATNLNVAQLNQIIGDTFKSNYVHFDTCDSLDQIDLFLSTLHEIFIQLKTLDYRELAPRNVILNDAISRTETRSHLNLKKSSDGRIVIKHPGKEENLSDGLD